METTAITRTASDRLLTGLSQLRELDLPPAGDAARTIAFSVAQIVRTLDADDDVVLAAMVQPLLEGKFIEGDTVREVLQYVQFSADDLKRAMRKSVERALRDQKLTIDESRVLLKFYENGLEGYTYLE